MAAGSFYPFSSYCRRIAFSILACLSLLLPSARASQAEPRRIVSTSPSITETLFALGLGPRVVGVSNYCEYPAEVTRLPRVGTYLNPDPELIARLDPDLVLVHKLSNQLTNRLAALHIPYAEVDRGTLQDSFAEILQIGAATGVPSRADDLVSSLKAQLRQIHARSQAGKPPTVVFVIGHMPGMLSGLVVVGKDAFLDELIADAGGRNAMASDSLPAYPRIGLETILRINPDVIVDMGDMGGSPGQREQLAAANRALWQAVPGLSAVRTGRVYCPTSTAFVVPGPRAPEAAELLYSMLHGRKPQ